MHLAARLGHPVAEQEHILLALLQGPDDTLAREARAALDITYDGLLGALKPTEPSPSQVGQHASGTYSGPTYHMVAGWAEGFALGIGLDAPRPEHVLLAIVWRPHPTVDDLLRAVGVDRSAVLASLASLGVPVPRETSTTTVLLEAAERQALALSHPFVGVDHLLLALLNGEPDDLARRALHACGVTYEHFQRRFLEVNATSMPPCPVVPGVADAAPNARAREMLARAEGLSAAAGDGPVRSEHALVAFLYDPDDAAFRLKWMANTTAADVATALHHMGGRMPTSPLPTPDRTIWGADVFVPRDRLMEVVARLHEEIPSGQYGFNHYGEKAWVSAVAHIDLASIVDRILAE